MWLYTVGKKLLTFKNGKVIKRSRMLKGYWINPTSLDIMDNWGVEREQFDKIVKENYYDGN